MTHSLAFSGDGQRLITGGNPIRLFDSYNLQETASLRAEGSLLFGLSFSPDGNLIAVLNLEGVAQIWRAPSWVEISAAEKANQPSP